jgi:deferrochelatase/peroxidase EfeB
LVRDGCYVVVRWIYQDVAKFNKFLRVESARLWPKMPAGDAQELLAAKLMGRWRNGTPLVLSPDRPDEAMALSNDFSYATDPNGSRCPFASHVRIANRRDDELTFANQHMFEPRTPRILRRGSSYGQPLVGEEDDGEDRGLIGMFLCSNINMQFYSIMRWINKTDFNPKMGDVRAQDPLFGNKHVRGASNTFQFEAQGENVAVNGPQDFIRTQGVLMLLLPSLSMLNQFSEKNA